VPLYSEKIIKSKVVHTYNVERGWSRAYAEKSTAAPLQTNYFRLKNYFKTAWGSQQSKLFLDPSQHV
jgi:hypothetical protein